MITLSLPDDVEIRLTARAASLGISASEYARRLIVDHLPSTPSITPDELFSQWAAEDPIRGPDDIAQRTREAEELTAALNKNRLESEGPGARTPFP